MATPNKVAAIGALIGDPARAAILSALIDGRALTASELAKVAGITPQTASSHLTKLVGAHMLHVEKQGRHRYFRLASGEVARLLESMMQLSAAPEGTKKLVTGPRDAAMRRARTCYDHMAGGFAVALADAFLEQGVIEFSDDSGLVTAEGTGFLERCGVQVEPVGARKRSSRPVCRPCLDWSERRPHIAGQLGAALCSHFLERNYIRRVGKSRTVDVTPKGRRALREKFGVLEF